MNQLENQKPQNDPAGLVGMGTMQQKPIERQAKIRGLQDGVAHGVEHLFSNLDLADRSRLKRLYLRALQEVSLIQRGSLPEPGQSLAVLQLFGRLTQGILEEMAAQSLRTPEERLRKSILNALGTGTESSAILRLAVKEALAKLQGSHALDCHCLVSKQVLGQTYEEITAFTGLTIQQVRYRIDRAKLLLKNLLEGKGNG